MKKKILISANTSWYIYNFRLSLIKKLQNSGYETAVLAPDKMYEEKLLSEGCVLYSVNMDRNSVNIINELRTIIEYIISYKKIRPDVVLHYTPKPNIYGALAAQFLRISTINNISGIGAAFNKKGVLKQVVKLLYRLTQRKVDTVFFQNPDDYKFFTKKRIISEEKSFVLPGSGVDLEKFSPVHAQDNKTVTFLLFSRLLWTKGVGIYIDAAREVKQTFPRTRFSLLGILEYDNPDSVHLSDIRMWEDENIVEWMGRAEDVRGHIARADCVVLPSYYREGVPKSLLEAASMEKPIITANTIGCRQVVEDGVTGFLIKPKSSVELAEKMKLMITMKPEDRVLMGQRGRKKMIEEFDEKIVLNSYLQTIENVLKTNNGNIFAGRDKR